MHNGFLLGTATFDRSTHQLSFVWHWEISPARQQDIQHFLMEFVIEREPHHGYERDCISMVTPHLYGFYVDDVSQTQISIQISVAEELSEEEEEELILIMEERRHSPS